ncbi:MAG: 50S ribosomal protein L4 [Holosporales bacterium]|jgi:large subunit ribosomal protein L4|nr:50S ribosomal protein L4 [Holosporales bacterium]
MIQVPVTTLEGESCSALDLDEAVFGVALRRACLAEVVRWQLARRQAGTHSSRGRGEVHGTTKKMYKQKGTGNARHGSRDVTQFRGGGIVFGPVPHAHDFKLNKKVRVLALKMLLSLKLREENLVVLKTLSLPLDKTKAAQEILRKRGLISALFVDHVEESNVFVRAIQNLKNIDFIPPEGLNVYDGLRHEKLVLTERSIEALTKRFQGSVVLC